MLTVSDSRSAEGSPDESGDAAEKWLRDHGVDAERAVVPDEFAQIEAALRRFVSARISIVLTTGGTGLGPRDVTPEATRRVIDREAPGIAELLRAGGRVRTPLAALSRGIAGIAEDTLVVNLPGSVKAVNENLAALEPILDHALDLVAGEGRH